MSLRNAIEVKRNADVMMDAINAEDIRKIKDMAARAQHGKSANPARAGPAPMPPSH